MNAQPKNHGTMDEIAKPAIPTPAHNTYGATFWNGDQDEDGCQGSFRQTLHVPDTLQPLASRATYIKTPRRGKL